MKKNIVRPLIVLLVLPFSLAVCFAQTNYIVAKVNNEVITSDDIEKYSQMLLNKNNKQIPDRDGRNFSKMALDRLIEDRLILEEAKKEEIEVPQAWLEGKIKELASTYPDRESFYSSLKEQGLTISYLKKRLRQQYLMKEVINRKVKSEVSVLPGQIEQFYKKNKKKFLSPPLAVFFIAKEKDKKELEDISDFIEREGIKKAAQKYSDQLSEINIHLNQLQESLSEALESLEDKEYLIKKIDDLYYLIYRKKVEPSRILTLSETQDKVYKHLWEKRFGEKFNQWVNSLKKDAVIKIYSLKSSQNS